MRRPADQAKLLFLYLLRSSAALATESKLGAAAAAASAASSAEASAVAAAASVSASASSVNGAASASVSVPSAASTPLTGHIALRVARRSDVPHIQRCNLATLPENYSANFYAQHMRQWPELALVAEHVPHGAGGTLVAAATTPRNGNGRRRPQPPSTTGRRRILPDRPLQSFAAGGYFDGRDDRREERRPAAREGDCAPRIVGYVLGKVDRGVVVRDYSSDPFASGPSSSSDDPAVADGANGSARNRVVPRSLVSDGYDGYDDDDEYESSFLWDTLRPGRPRPRPRPRRENLGHVTSLAVLPDFRRRGLAAELMTQLHRHMRAPPYRADAVGLHVRVSNRAATRLYGGDGCASDDGHGGDGNADGNSDGGGGMGYKVADVIRSYYQDGEDAYFMRKEFSAEEEDAAMSPGDARQRLGSVDRGSSGRVRRALDRLQRVGGGRAALLSTPWEGGGGGNAGPAELRLPRYIPLAPDAEVVSSKRADKPKAKVAKKVAVNGDYEMEEEEEEEQVMSGAA